MNDLRHFILISPDPCCEALGSLFQCNSIRSWRMRLSFQTPTPCLLSAQTYFNVRVKRLRLAALKKQKKDEERKD